MSVLRYIRAFFKALKLTLSGQTITTPPVKQPHIYQWAQELGEMLESAESAVKNESGSGWVSSTRIVVDKRTLSVEQALQAIRHHARVEYPYLLKNYDPRYSVMTLQATNLNDQYLVQKLLEVPELSTSARDAFTRLLAHMASVPKPQSS